MFKRVGYCAVLVFSCLALSACATAPAPVTFQGYMAATAPRVAVNLDPDWKFIRQDVPGAQAVDYDDSAWQDISLPHTWNNLDGEDGPDPVTWKANYYRGIGWYRKHINLAGMGLGGKSLYLRFDAASIVTDVWVNGASAGAPHMGAFGAFCYDVTRLMNTSGDNVIAVRVNNALNKDVAPLAGDFTMFGGIYRSVHLLALNPVAIDPMDDASSGVYIQETSVSPQSAALQITTKLRNDTADTANATVQCDILDATGQAVMTLIAPASINSESKMDSLLTTSIQNPHLWDGRKDPYLYHVRVTVSVAGVPSDCVVQPLGLRFFKVDPDRGFFLDGQHYSIHGVARHQDRQDMGWAITDKQQKQDFDMIMDLGCTGVRLSHYEQAQDFYDLCDQGGLIVWAEDGLINTTTVDSAFDDNMKQQLRELIKQNYNHPSICFWSLYNELRDPDPKTDKQDPKVQYAHQIKLVKELNDLAHKLDPGRLTTAASFRPSDNELHRITDVIAFNRYNGWYRGQLTDWGPELDHIHQTLPDRGIAISEYGAGAGLDEFEPNPQRPWPTTGLWHPEEYQCIVHEQAYAAMKQRPYLWATFVWNMFDFASDGRAEGEHEGINDKGLVSYDRTIKKDAYYFYKANWSDQPVMFITEKRFTPRPMDDAPIKVYSNCDSVDLTINGVSQGVKSVPDHIFVWQNVTLARGVNHIEASGAYDGKPCTDAADIVYDPGARIWKPTGPTTKPSTLTMEPAVEFNPNWPNP